MSFPIQKIICETIQSCMKQEKEFQTINLDNVQITMKNIFLKRKMVNNSVTWGKKCRQILWKNTTSKTNFENKVCIFECITFQVIEINYVRARYVGENIQKNLLILKTVMRFKHKSPFFPIMLIPIFDPDRTFVYILKSYFKKKRRE